MSRYHGAGLSRDLVRKQKRAEAEERNARTPPQRRRATRRPADPPPRCTKRPFRSEESATQQLLAIWRQFPNDPVRREIRVYECPQCKPKLRWHLTSKGTQ